MKGKELRIWLDIENFNYRDLLPGEDFRKRGYWSCFFAGEIRSAWYKPNANRTGTRPSLESQILGASLSSSGFESHLPSQ